MATLGRAQVEVFRRPTVGIISIGDDIVMPGSDCSSLQTFDVNRYTIGATLNHWGASAVPFPAVRDDIASIMTTLEMALSNTALPSC